MNNPHQIDSSRWSNIKYRNKKVPPVAIIFIIVKSTQRKFPQLMNLIKTTTSGGKVFMKSTPGICLFASRQLKSINSDKSYPANCLCTNIIANNEEANRTMAPIKKPALPRLILFIIILRLVIN